jgi:Fe-Mn family superoxide dismutase
MAFTVPDLPYPYEALEPYIDTETMKIHHDKHHGAYVSNLNKALEGSELLNSPVEILIRDLTILPEELRMAVRNNGGGHLNHSLFWTQLGPAGEGKPAGSLAAAIDRDLGGFDKLKAELIKAGIGRFGSGWSWLSLDTNRKLVIGSTANQDNPLSEGKKPILGIDVWEHAYYLKYQNRRADYLEAIFHVLDWKAIGQRFEKAMAS